MEVPLARSSGRNSASSREPADELAKYASFL
jgi:hypothetical protein